MNDYIARYIYDVTKRLDEPIREDISKELEANIYDMLGDDTSDENIKKVLTDLGSPAKMAMNYKTPRYLISPELFDDYLHVLVIVMLVFAGIAFASGIIEAVMGSGVEILAGIMETIFGSMLYAAFNGFAVTTLIFAGIELYNKKTNHPFKVESLPKIPKVESKKSLRVELIVESVFSIVFGILFVYALIYNYVDINIVSDDLNFVYSGDVINSWVSSVFVPWFMIYLVLTVVIKVFQFKEGGFTKVLASFYTALELSSLIMMSIIFTRPNAFNETLISTVSTAFNIDFPYHLGIAIRGIVGLVWVITTIDLIVTWYKLYHPKTNKKQKN
ncbi:hypothetical protein N7603_05800 [Acholeplasma vituli]|uniref:ABC transporter permease n=1 Tax=Paracholeplasma vituli TaxID=69473 RepID=A0ABT2PXJ0_9MOLU|nr:hypothetical protein [Paracholeplasma vituli]MCU0105166.1 hypothetical protein [Paracholeplasma vituli]